MQPDPDRVAHLHHLGVHEHLVGRNVLSRNVLIGDAPADVDRRTDTPARQAPQRASSLALRSDERPNWRTSIPFLAFHAVPVLAVFTGVSLEAVVLAVVSYAVRMFFITAGYHRYFAHRSYRTVESYSSSSPSVARPHCRRAHCGGRVITVPTTVTPTPNETSTRR